MTGKEQGSFRCKKKDLDKEAKTSTRPMPLLIAVVDDIDDCVVFGLLTRQPIAVSDISIYICLIDIRDGSGKPVYGGVDRLQALSSAKTGRRSCFFMN